MNNQCSLQYEEKKKIIELFFLYLQQSKLLVLIHCIFKQKTNVDGIGLFLTMVSQKIVVDQQN
jgi:hypothetical protein